MQTFNPEALKKLYIPAAASHKAQNGKLLIIGGSHLFHAASLWALQIASRIVDMVFYSSVPENNQIVHELKKEFRNGIIIPREKIDDYIDEADAVVIGPGMMRSDVISRRHDERSRGEVDIATGSLAEPRDDKMMSLQEINALVDEGEQSYYLTKYLLEKYPEKKWVIDAGALQMMEPEWLLGLHGNVVITPHPGEFSKVESGIKNSHFAKATRDKHESVNTLRTKSLEEQVSWFAKEYNCIVLLKGEEDVVCSPEQCVRVPGGNAGMTKGGTGDVLAGLVGALACKNNLWLAATAGSFFNKKAGESLFKRVGYYFNASDLADEIPKVMQRHLFE